MRSNRLAINQKIQIRSGRSAGARSYTVRKGDSVGRIAQTQNTTINGLLRANGLSRSSKIYPGQVIQLPN